MKQPIKSSAIFGFFCLLWIFPLINKNTEKHIWIFIIGFTLCVLCLMLIKNTVLSFLSASVSAFVPIAFHFYYLFLILPSITVIFYFVYLQKKAVTLKNMYSDKIGNKKKQNTFSHASEKKITPAVYAGAALSFIVSTGIWIYLFFNKFTGQNTTVIKKYELTQMIIFGLFFVFGALALICIPKKNVAAQTAYNKGFTDTALISLKSLYISAFFCFIQSIFSFYISNNNLTEGYERVFFFPWFIYFFLITYYEDPVFFTLTEKGKTVMKIFQQKFSHK